MCDERGLQRVQGRPISQPFDSLNLSSIKLSRQGVAGKYGLAVEQNGTGTTCGLIACDFRSHQAKLVAKQFRQGHMRGDRVFARPAVHPQRQPTPEHWARCDAWLTIDRRIVHSSVS